MRQAGQGLAEYALLVSLIVVVGVMCVLWFGKDLAHIWSAVGRAL